MSNFIVGQDISYAQGVIDWQTYKNNTNFVIIQSSYGNGYFDSQYGNNKGQVLQTTLPHGYYHFAYPDLNSAVDEANWFLHAIGAIKPLQPGELLFLDYERTCSDNVGWVKTFLDTVSNALGGYKPILYTYQDMLTSNDFSSVANEGYGLWIAAPTNDPTNNNFQTGAFPFAMMQQWGTQSVPGISGQVDGDVFFGNQQAFLSYGYKPITAPLPPTTPSAPSPQPSTPTPTVPPAGPVSSPVGTQPSQPPITPPVVTPPTTTQPPSSGDTTLPKPPQDGNTSPNQSLLSKIWAFLVSIFYYKSN